ncbi:MAG: GNAT family N-acetyltransferase, partial [Nannocystaceae bacterium]
MITYRVATVADIPAMMTIRNNVRENPLVHIVLTTEDYTRAMTIDGRAWVCEHDSEVVGFSCGRRVQGDIWALFVRETHEGRGIGSRLMELVESWMFGEGLDELWLVTAPGTRAERLYRSRGWVSQGLQPSG